MALPNPFAALSSWWNPQAVEADVLLLIAKAKAGVATAAADLKAAFNWIDANAGTIAKDIEQVLLIAGKLGAVGNPQLAALVASANAAVTALNAYASSRASGNNQASAAVDGYLAVSKANELHAQIGTSLASATYEPVTKPLGVLSIADMPIDVRIVVKK